MKLVIIDANVVIDGHRFGFWNPLLASCKVYLTPTIVEECKFWEDQQGDRHPIDLAPQITAKRIEVLDDITVADFSFVAGLNEVHAKSIDDGEMEAIAAVMSGRYPGHHFCTGEAAALVVLSILKKGNMAVSVEELIAQRAVQQKLPHNFKRRFKDEKLQQGIMLQKK